MVLHLQDKHSFDREKNTFDKAKIEIPDDKVIVEETEIPIVDLIACDPAEQSQPAKRVKLSSKKFIHQARTSNPKISQFVQQFTDVQLREAQESLAEFAFTKGLPFTVFESAAWDKFISLVAPAFKTPSERQLRTTFLDRVHQRYEKKIIGELKQANSITLSIDESKLARTTCRTNFLACTPQPRFLVSYDAGEASITTDYLEGLLTKTLARFDINVHAIITDNGSNIKALRNRVEKTNDVIALRSGSEPQVIKTLGIYCVCHGINLIMQDFMNDRHVKGRLEVARAIANKLNNNSEVRRIFSSRLTQELILKRFNVPPTIRWLHMKQLFEDLIKYEIPIRTMIHLDHVKIEKHLTDRSTIDYKQLDEPAFWSDLGEIMKAIKPLCRSITACESTSSTIADAFVVMWKLAEKKDKFIEYMRNEAMDDHSWSNKFDQRFRAIISVHHRLAAFLDPRYRGEEYTRLKYRDAEKMLIETAQALGLPDGGNYWKSLRDSLDDFCQAKEPFDENSYRFFSNEMTSVSWWDRYASDTAIYEVAKVLMSVPSSNASVERSFSHQGLIFSKRRRNMAHETLNKLTAIKFNSASQTSKITDYRQFVDTWEEFNLEQTIEEHVSIELEDDELMESADVLGSVSQF